MADIYHPGRVPDWFYGGAPASQPGLGAALAPSAPVTAPGATSPVPVGTSATSGPIYQGFPDYSHVEHIINQINATNQQAQQAANVGRIPGAQQLETQSSQDIAALLNPPTQFGEIDVPSAARAVFSGTVGSPFAGVTGLNLSENERIRRQQIGQQMLGAAYARNPAAPIADPQALVSQLEHERFGAQESALNRALQAQLAFLRLPHGGGGGGYGPRLPTDYGGTPAEAATYRAGIPDAATAGATAGGGSGTLFSIPQGAIPDNWNDLTFEQQAQYAAGIAANPYYDVPDYANPYANEYDPDLAYQYMATEYPGYAPQMGYQTTP